jgi:aryl-alcohol dehydrogenase-like predicted oxidoreductase
MIPVVGASTVAQLDELLGAVDLQLGEDVRQRLDRAGRHGTLRPTVATLKA